MADEEPQTPPEEGQEEETPPTGEAPPAPPVAGEPGGEAGGELPEKFRGKSAPEIAQAYTELEKKLGGLPALEQKARLFDQVSPILMELAEPEEGEEVPPEGEKGEGEPLTMGQVKKMFVTESQKLLGQIQRDRTLDRELSVELATQEEKTPRLKSDPMYRMMVAALVAPNAKTGYPGMELARAVEQIDKFLGVATSQGRQQVQTSLEKKVGASGIPSGAIPPTKPAGEQPKDVREAIGQAQKELGEKS